MFKRLPHKDISADLQVLLNQLRQDGDCAVIEDEHHRPIACLTPLPIADHLNGEQEDWAQVAKMGLRGAYGDDEPEYSSSLVKEPNAEYERR